MEQNKQSLELYEKLPAHQAGMMVEPADANNSQNQPDQRFLPLTEINADVEIKEQIAYIKLTQEYQSLYIDAPISVTFKFPREPSSVISKLEITSGDKKIRAKIRSVD